MSIERKQIGPTQHYRGRNITAHELSIDVLIKIDGSDFGNYLSAESGRKSAMAHIDDICTREEKDKK